VAERAKRPAVLLIEPPDDSRDMYADYLTQRGFEARTSDNADEGLTKVQEADVVVTGVYIQGSFDGVELVRRVRLHEPNKPVIVLTAFDTESNRLGAQQAGCNAFLAKPCLPDTLVREIRRVLSLRPAERDRERG
jgi:two-component system cell cycle response regulator DivK